MTFKELRLKSKLSQKYIAEKLGIKLETYKKYEYSMRLPSNLILSRMKNIYNCSGDELLDAFNFHKEIQIKRYGRINP